MDSPVASWVRWGLLVGLAIPQLVTGLWAVLSPSNWFDSFPGVGPALVAAEPPFNSHLATDSGAGFVATGVALVFAFFWCQRRPVLMALGVYAAFSVPHTLYHLFNPAPGLSGAEDAVNVLTLIGGLVLAVILAWGAQQRRPAST